jgi:multiple sugar transport system substrate-binding protein
MQFSKKQLYIIIGAAVAIGVVVFLVVSNIKVKPTANPVTLNVWGTISRDTFENKLAAGYKTLRPNATVKYTQLDPANYDNAVVQALAAGNGPDVLFIGNHDLPKRKSLLVPVDPVQFGAASLAADFPTVVGQDFSDSGQIYALPLSIDTMTLIYNKDAFDQAAIPNPPRTWAEFQTLIPKLRVLNQAGQLTKSAAAIGASEKSIDRATDLLNLLMLQNSAAMTDARHGTATFAGTQGSSPGLGAFSFYLQFANAASPLYTWSENEGNSLESFAAGQVVMVMDYHGVLASLKKKNPFLNIGVAEMPQVSVDNVVNYASYQGLAVSKQSKASAWAWDFIIYATTNADATKGYLASTGEPPALRSLIAADLNDADLGVFAKQALTARSWYIPDYEPVKNIFNTAIGNVLAGKLDSLAALRNAQDQVSQLLH